MDLKYTNILVEDDCILIPNDIKNDLKSQVYKTHFFDTSFEAENIIKHHHIDLLVIHNKKILEDIRKNYTKTELPILLLTKDIQKVEDILEYANDFLNASVIKTDLIAKIRHTLNRCHKLKSLIELANKDYLTNTYNKRYFYEIASKAYHESKNIAVYMIDIDNFKAINDTYGHIVGDYAIKELANILKKNTKGKDIVARFGGDEFCVLLRDIDEQNTKLLLDKLKKEVEKNSFYINQTPINFTITVGVTTNKHNSLEEMISFADLELLKAKDEKPKLKLCTNCHSCEEVA